MKHILLFIVFVIALSFTSFAQTGPGGVGNSNTNILWLDASKITAIDNSQIASWNDISGNNNHASQTSTIRQPVYSTNLLNGEAVVEFDGVDDLMDLSTHIVDSTMTFFTVFKSYINGPKAIFRSGKHFVLGRNIDAYALYDSRFSIRKKGVEPSIFSLTSGAQEVGNFFMTVDENSKTVLRTSFHNSTNTTIGGTSLTTSHSFNGYISEIIVFNIELNSAERNIVINYLSSKYNLPAIKELYSYEAGYSNGIFGIGQEVDGNQILSRKDSLLVQNPSDMDNGEYLLIGNNAMGYATTNAVGAGVIERWEQVWRADKTGAPGAVDLEFFLGANDFANPNNYVILIETQDGDFSNGGYVMHEAGRSYDTGKNSIKFTGVDLPDGAYFTLAEKDGILTSVSGGNWNNPEIWSCGCVPSMEDLVIADDSIVISSNQSVLDITINNGGSLTFSGSDTLFVYGDFTHSGTFYPGNGTIAAVKPFDQQNFINNSSQFFTFYNLYVNNGNKLRLVNGNWSLKNNLQVSGGSLDVSSSNKFTMLSDINSTAQILPSINSAFAGSFTIQRYIGARNAGWADLSSPVANTTVADLDDDLYISGVNGNDGNVTVGGSIFYSMFAYDNVNAVHEAITSTSTILKAGKGYELWLADSAANFYGKAVDFNGIPNDGTNAVYVYQGWNFVGNPYQSFIAYDSILKSSWIPDNYYIWNTHNGSYDFFNGSGKPAIAPAQGFWIQKSSPGRKTLLFTENIKVNSKSSSFLRQKSEEEFNLNITSAVVPYSHKMQVGFSIFSSDTLDERDAFYLKSKLEEAPAITTRASHSNEELIYSSLDPLESSQTLPVSVYIGLAGEYLISAANLDALSEHYNCVFLVDKKKNTSIDLIAQSNYTFVADKGNHDRFSLIMSNSYKECQNLVKEGFTQNIDDQFNLRNEYNQWHLDYDLEEKSTQIEIRIFNMSGQEVKASQSFEASGSGTYQLRNLEELKGIYLIQVKSNGELLNKTIIL